MSGWNTVESDSGVFTELIEKFGVQGAEFENVLSIDGESLAAVRPLYGLIFLFKYRSSEYENSRSQAAPLDGKYVPDAPIFFAHQKIQNACATQAVLSIILNQQAISVGEELANFKSFVDSFDPDLRGDAISNSETIRSVHNSFSRPNPFVDEDNDRDHDENEDGIYHFIAYVPVNGELYELDGLLPYPISHGPCTFEEFPAKLSQVLQRRVSRGPSGEIRFDAIALTKDKREDLKNAGDLVGLAQEEEKRADWKRENALRRENFVSLIHKLVEGVSSTKSDAEWSTMLDTARGNSKRRLENMRAQREKWN